MLIIRIIKKIIRRSILEYRGLLWRINRKLRDSVTIRTKQGVFTVSCADNHIGKTLYLDGEFEMELIRRVTSFLQDFRSMPPGGTLLDIGANIGITSVGLIRDELVEKAIAIEPDPYNFSMLQQNVLQNGLIEKMVCLRLAVCDKKGMVQFEISNDNLGDHRIRRRPPLPDAIEKYGETSRGVIEVESDCLDNLAGQFPKDFLNDLALVWIDVQGHEGFVFLGGKKFFSQNIPVVAEIWPYGLKQAGMSREEFCKIAAEIWSSFWVIRRKKFVRYPISILYTFFDELGDKGDFDNVIFTH